MARKSRNSRTQALLRDRKPINSSPRLQGGALEIAKQLLEQHARCDYKKLLDRAASSKVRLHVHPPALTHAAHQEDVRQSRL